METGTLSSCYIFYNLMKSQQYFIYLVVKKKKLQNSYRNFLKNIHPWQVFLPQSMEAKETSR